jgi:hypothetical protein
MRFLIADLDHDLPRLIPPVEDGAHPDPQGLRSASSLFGNPLHDGEIRRQEPVIIKVAVAHEMTLAA